MRIKKPHKKYHSQADTQEAIGLYSDVYTCAEAREMTSRERDTVLSGALKKHLVCTTDPVTLRAIYEVLADIDRVQAVPLYLPSGHLRTNYPRHKFFFFVALHLLIRTKRWEDSLTAQIMNSV